MTQAHLRLGTRETSTLRLHGEVKVMILIILVIIIMLWSIARVASEYDFYEDSDEKEVNEDDKS